ncbi:MAG: hypothetical protein ACK559_11055, partial [bacterium]
MDRHFPPAGPVAGPSRESHPPRDNSFGSGRGRGGSNNTGGARGGRGGTRGGHTGGSGRGGGSSRVN